jgi:parvulin-like peptidyl-prolyl isomerase
MREMSGIGFPNGLKMKSIVRMIFRLIFCAGLPVLGVGCGSDKAQPVSPQDFYAPVGTVVVGPTPTTLPDSPGLLQTLEAQNPGPVTKPSAEFMPKGAIAQATTLPDVADAASTRLSAGPSTEPSVAGDQYLTLGGVVMVVNGRPIYADKVLRMDANILRQTAKQMSMADFEDAARNQIERTINELRDNELEIAAAERTLDPKDIQLAKVLTAQWSKHEISEVGGSEQIARIRAHASGEEFQDQEQDQFRHYLQDLYYYRKIIPQIDISPDDERRFYRAHIDDFTTPMQAEIILIEADPANLNGSRQAAIDKLKKLRERAMGGEDFAAYGRDQNDLPSATGDNGNGGRLTIKPNTFVYTAVEAQVWKTPVGQISDVIEDHDVFFILKVLSRDEGGTKSFADQAVQQAIYKRLFDLQRQEHRQTELRKLVLEAIVFTDPHMIDAAVEMAMQNYSRWAKS